MSSCQLALSFRFSHRQPETQRHKLQFGEDTGQRTNELLALLLVLAINA